MKKNIKNFKIVALLNLAITFSASAYESARCQKFADAAVGGYTQHMGNVDNSFEKGPSPTSAISVFYLSKGHQPRADGKMETLFVDIRVKLRGPVKCEVLAIRKILMDAVYLR